MSFWLKRHVVLLTEVVPVKYQYEFDARMRRMGCLLSRIAQQHSSQSFPLLSGLAVKSLKNLEGQPCYPAGVR